MHIFSKASYSITLRYPILFFDNVHIKAHAIYRKARVSIFLRQHIPVVQLEQYQLYNSSYTSCTTGIVRVAHPVASLLFSQRGVKVSSRDFIDPLADSDPIIGNRTIRQNGLDIPINLKYTIGLGSSLGIYVAAGPDFYFNFSGDKVYENYGRLNKKNAQIGINVGAGVKLLRHLQVGANYNIPLNKTAEWKEADFSYKTKMWQISAAYIF